MERYGSKLADLHGPLIFNWWTARQSNYN